MPLAPLATIQDVADRIGRTLTSSEEARVAVLLDDASAAVRAYTGQEFDQSTGTTRVKVRRGKARLPQRPVTAVSTVKDVNGNTILFTWLGGDVVQVGQSNLDSFSFVPWRSGIQVVDVTYTHGYATTPPVVVAVVAQIAARAFGQPADQSGLQQETLGSYSYSIGSAAAAGGVGMLPAERAALDLFRREGGVAYSGV